MGPAAISVDKSAISVDKSAHFLCEKRRKILAQSYFSPCVHLCTQGLAALSPRLSLRSHGVSFFGIHLSTELEKKKK